MGDGDSVHRDCQAFVHHAQAAGDLPAAVCGHGADHGRDRGVQRSAVESVFRAVAGGPAVRGGALHPLVGGAAARVGGDHRADFLPPRLAGADHPAGDRHGGGQGGQLLRGVLPVPGDFGLRASAFSVRADRGPGGHGAGRIEPGRGGLALADLQHWRGDWRGVRGDLRGGAGHNRGADDQAGAAVTHSVGGFDSVHRILSAGYAAGFHLSPGADIRRAGGAVLGDRRRFFRGDNPHGGQPDFAPLRDAAALVHGDGYDPDSVRQLHRLLDELRHWHHLCPDHHRHLPGSQWSARRLRGRAQQEATAGAA